MATSKSSRKYAYLVLDSVSTSSSNRPLILIFFLASFFLYLIALLFPPSWPSSPQTLIIMDPKQEHHAQQAPEVVPTSTYPEAVSNGGYQYQHQQYPKPEGSYGGTYSSYNASQLDQVSPRPYHSAPGADADLPPSEGKKRSKACCGCGALVFILLVIIAILLAAVIGLGAGLGVENRRADDVANQLKHAKESLSSASGLATATVTVTSTSAATATSTSFASLDDNCSGNPDGVTGTTYNAFSCKSAFPPLFCVSQITAHLGRTLQLTHYVHLSVYGDYSFTLKCNADALGDPLISIFTSDINTCMDSCAAYSGSMTTHFGNNTNSTCGGVSFIPLWTNKTAALVGGAPGNCYLKPTQTGSPNTPNIGTECHAGILNTS